MPDICEMKCQFRTSVAPDYDRVVEDWKKGRIHSEEAAMELLIILKVYFDEMKKRDLNEPWFDMEALIEIVKGDKTYKTECRNYELGRFVHALCLLGSPKEQAYKAMGLWLGNKRSYYKKCLEFFQGKGLYKEITEAESFICLNFYQLRKVIDAAEKPFPKHKDIVMASGAYDRLLHILEIKLRHECDVSLQLNQKLKRFIG